MLRAFAMTLFVPLILTTELGMAAHGGVSSRSWSGDIRSDHQPLGSSAAQAGLDFTSSPLLAKKKKKKRPDVWVTEAEVTSEQIGETWYYTLRGKVRNRGEESVTRPVVYYEIYDQETNTIVEAGALPALPKFLAANGGEATFQKLLSKNGKVKITLVGWYKEDKTTQSHRQLEFFPRPEPKE